MAIFNVHIIYPIEILCDGKEKFIIVRRSLVCSATIFNKNIYARVFVEPGADIYIYTHTYIYTHIYTHMYNAYMYGYVYLHRNIFYIKYSKAICSEAKVNMYTHIVPTIIFYFPVYNL